jgi:hypothetical protein
MDHLSPIYTCDVLSFLPQSQLLQSRLVSHALNNMIAGHPSRLKARRRLSSLIVEVGWWPKFGENGYAELGPCTDGMDGMGAENWEQLQEKWGCCRELKV